MVMDVSSLVWGLTVGLIIGLLLFDFFFHVRQAHSPTLREATIWSGIYVGIAIAFGVGVWVFGGSAMGSQYFAGYLTEKALSIDNLFVFLVIITSFKVPRADQQKVLLFGIVFSLIARTGFIFIGVALIDSFAWVFYIFGLILLLTAGNLIKPESEDSHSADNVMIRIARRFLHTSDDYDGDKLFINQNGKRVMTPMLLVMVAIGGTDILFALDSIPAIFGLTQDVFLVFTATAFSLLGLRQLYFLLDDLLDRLIYLSYGLAAILAFIGAKLILHALHENNVPLINDGKPVAVIEISTNLSLIVIIAVLLITVITSLSSRRGKAQTAVLGAKRHAAAYCDLHYETHPAVREDIYNKMVAEEEQMKNLPESYRVKIKDEDELMALLKRAHEQHDLYLSERSARTAVPPSDASVRSE
jgi:TerC family integral membrane protein